MSRRSLPHIRMVTLLVLQLALTTTCSAGVPATASPSATATPPPPTPTFTTASRDPLSPALPTATPTAERPRATFATIVIAVTYVPTPTPYPPPLLATATAASERVPTSIAAAEAEGVVYPRLDPAPAPPETFAHAPGDSARRCVPVEGSGTRGIRSGEFAAGAFDIFLDSWRQDGAGKVWWVPEHSLRGIEIVVRGVRLDTPADTVRQQIRGANADFFPSLVALPSGGTWLLIATGGPNCGCFILALPT